MRKSTIAGLIILCGSTAAIANAATAPVGGFIQNTTNNTATPDPTPAPAPAPEPTPDAPAPNATM